MAASSAKFFVHQNQNKANSSGAESVVGDCKEINGNDDIASNELRNKHYVGDFTSTKVGHTANKKEYTDKIHYKSGTDRRSATTVSGFGAEVSEAFVDIEEVISTKTAIVNSKSHSGGGGDGRGNKRNPLQQHSGSANITAVPEEINNSSDSKYLAASTLNIPKKFHNYDNGNEGIAARIGYQLQTQNNKQQTVRIPNRDTSSLQLAAKTPSQWTDKIPTKILNIRAPPLSLAPTSLSSSASSFTNFAMNSSQSSQAPGNRITFTSQTLPNGTINIGGATGHPAGSTIISTSQLPNTTTIKTITSSGGGQQHHSLPQQVQVQHHQVLQTGGQPGLTVQPSQQHHNAATQSVGATQTQTLVIKSNNAVSLPAGLVSSAPGIVTMTKTINQVRRPKEAPIPSHDSIAVVNDAIRAVSMLCSVLTFMFSVVALKVLSVVL